MLPRSALFTVASFPLTSDPKFKGSNPATTVTWRKGAERVEQRTLKEII